MMCPIVTERDKLKKELESANRHKQGLQDMNNKQNQELERYRELMFTLKKLAQRGYGTRKSIYIHINDFQEKEFEASK